MDCCVSYNRIPIGESLPAVVKFEGDLKVFAKIGFSDSSRYLSIRSQGILKVCGTRGFGRRIQGVNQIGQPVFASARSSHCEFSSLGTPLETRSSAGRFLSGVLQNQRHLFRFAVEQQLEELAADRNGAFARKEHSLGSSESCLHRRIAEMKEYECQIAVEDVMYMLIIHRFSEIKVPMVPKLCRCVNNGTLDVWPSKDKELEAFYNVEVQEMIREHLATILRWRVRSNGTGNSNWTQFRRLQLGRIYAASVMYGYFLKSAYLRHQLELSLTLTQEDLPLRQGIHFSCADFHPRGTGNFVFLSQSSNTPRSTSLCQESRKCVKEPEKLRGFVMGFDSNTLRRCAKLKSQEAVNLIEKHTWALFEDEKTGDLETDEEVIVTVPSLKRLVLEAVAFGSFLWDVERYVDSQYSLKDN